jgi:asparagine synthetase B (glutamine-hydrolysing)
MARDDLGVTESHSTSYPFETEANDVEKQYALSAAEALGAKHRFFVPTTRQFLRGFLDAVSVAEEPIVHTQSVLMLLMLRNGLPAGEGTVVVGQGADGAFGLRIHQTVERVERFRAHHPRLAAALHPSLWGGIQRLLTLPPVSNAMRRTLSRLRRDSGVIDVLPRYWGAGVPLSHPRHVLWALGAVGDEKWARRHFGAARTQVISNRLATIQPYADRGVLDALSLLDFLGDVAVTQSVWSKFGESARKVVYYPFNSRALIDRAFETPWRLKNIEPKGVLRDVARRVGVPEFIVARKKANFNVNPDRWALPGGVFDPLVPIATQEFGEEEVRRMQAPDWRGAYTFWMMLNYAVWKRIMIEGQNAGSLLAEAAPAVSDAELTDEPILAAGH